MNLPSILIWGFAATIVLTGLTIAAQSLGLTRIDLPFIIGTMLTSNRDRARVIGTIFHIVNGWIFAVVYALFFQQLRMATWWLGAVMGCLQGLFVVVAVLPILPGMHPRMVSDFRGPEPTRLLEPPGFLAVNYGRATPWVLMLGHACYGLILGLFYRLR
ncbi:MAG TPA: hypothetical protein VG323_18315 [Thermoanaerobaculia bacterium]|nr:hypothetical protein [Thermoanaerobaculia bacterium]